MKHGCPECSRRAAEFCQIEEQRNALAARVDALEAAIEDAEILLQAFAPRLSIDDDTRAGCLLENWRRDGLLKEGT